MSPQVNTQEAKAPIAEGTVAAPAKSTEATTSNPMEKVMLFARRRLKDLRSQLLDLAKQAHGAERGTTETFALICEKIAEIETQNTAKGTAPKDRMKSVDMALVLQEAGMLPKRAGNKPPKASAVSRYLNGARWSTPELMQKSITLQAQAKILKSGVEINGTVYHNFAESLRKGGLSFTRTHDEWALKLSAARTTASRKAMKSDVAEVATDTVDKINLRVKVTGAEAKAKNAKGSPLYPNGYKTLAVSENRAAAVEVVCGIIAKIGSTFEPADHDRILTALGAAQERGVAEAAERETQRIAEEAEQKAA